VLETDAECAGQAPTLAPGGAAAPALLTCALPAALSFEVFAAVAAFRAACRLAADTAEPTSGRRASCTPGDVLASVEASYSRFRAHSAVAARQLILPGEVLAAVRRYSLEEVEAAGRAAGSLWSPEARARWAADPAALGPAALAVCRQLGLGRRVLFWRANMLQAVAEFGLAAHLPALAPRAQFFNSRVEVLAELLDGPPAQGRRFVEVGVHLARVAFALLSGLRGLHYIGVDPFVYDEGLTSPESTAHQLRDLGLDPEAEGGGAAELRGEVRRAAEAKLALFPDRAELLALPSVEAAARLPDHSVDGVFIDGDHSYKQVVRDIAAWEPKVRPGGILSGHDFGNHPDVARAVLEHAAAGNRTVHLAMDWVWYWRV